MADIYLTKIERKTIFTRALIYVLILFVVADMTVTGPFFINFIPCLYILSIMINIRGVDRLLTAIIGTFTAFIASLITNNGFNLTTLSITLNTALQLGLGMGAAAIIHEFILEHRLVKYIIKKKKIELTVLLIVFTLISLFSMSTVHGDVFTYLKSKNNLNNYISKTYNEEYKLKKVIYNKKVPGKYAYVVTMEGEEVHFVPVLNTTFKDVNQENRLSRKNNELKKEVENSIKNIVENKKILKEENFEFKYEYTKASILPDSLVAYININSKKTSKLYNEIAASINEIAKIEVDITEFVVTIEGTSLHIPYVNISLVTPEYIEGGFNIEDLDE